MPDPWPVLEITPRPVRRRRRRTRALGRGAAAVAGAVVLAVGAVTILGDDDPDLTWRGEQIDEPDAVLARAEERLAAVVEARGGVTARSSRCSFSRPAEDGTDVAEVVRCGPVLFVDGDPDEVWLTFALTGEEGSDGDTVVLEVAPEPDPTDPVALDPGEELVRPDGRTAPEGSGGLEVPLPRRAEAGFLRRDALDGVDLAAPEGAASVVTHGARYSVTGLARPERIGQGDEARRPAEGERFLAVELAQGPGEVAGVVPTDVVRVEVEGEEPVALPEVDEAAPDVTGTYLLSAPAAGAVDLVVTTGAVVQRLSLVDGTRGDDTASVLLRETRQADVGRSGPLVFSLAQGGQVSPVARLTVGVRVVRLAYFYGADGTRVPPEPAQAWLVVGTSYTWPPEARGPGGALVRAGLGPEVWRLRVGGRTVAAVDLAPEPDRVAIAFAVPADITEGTLLVGGTQPGSVVFDTGPNRVEIPFRLPA